MESRRKKQLFGILLLAFSLMYLVSLAGHAVSDDLQITSDESTYGNPFTLTYVNFGGLMGAYLSYVTFLFLGWPAYAMVILLAVVALCLIGFDFGRRLLKHAAILWAVAFQFFMLVDVSDVAAGAAGKADLPDGAGLVGQALLGLAIRVIGAPGSYIFFACGIICTLVFYASISHRFRNAAGATGRLALAVGHRGTQTLLTRRGDQAAAKRGAQPSEARVSTRRGEAKAGGSNADGGEQAGASDGKAVPEDKIVLHSPRPARASSLTGLGGKETDPAKAAGKNGPDARPAMAAHDDFIMPGPELLNKDDQAAIAFDERELSETAKTLRETLEIFGVRLSGNIEMFPGPVITRYEIKPAAGIKVNQIANLSEDLALNLKAKSIRIVAPIPGKAAVGIEIPNRQPQMVYLRDIVTSDKFLRNKYHLPIVLGKDIGGGPFVADLASMPHLLIAGTTGSGKSVCINVVITSLMFALHPDQLRFIFVDPKMLELSVYKGIPYLDEDVVTNAKQAERVLSGAVTEMENRYRLLAAAATRNIVDYNVKQKTPGGRLPYVVIIIDELADLMMSASSSRVELLITRLAQMARAVGIHLILATQRPSVDVITGLIKANFPSRIAFQVATKIDSRTILDGNGAERLLGRGDMLYLEAGSPEAIRLHGAFISSEETERTVTFLRDQAYSLAKHQDVQAASAEKENLRQFDDPVLLEAVETVIRQGQASVSLLQRKLGVGYQRAARLIDELEEMKVIGEYNESKARDVLVDKGFLESIKRGRINKT